MHITPIIGLIAAALTTVSFVPQVVRVYSTKSAKDISLGMFLIFSLGVFLWLSYGLLVGDTPIIVANSVTFVLAITIVFAKLRYS